MSFLYELYGFSLRSVLELPELPVASPPAGGSIDVELELTEPGLLGTFAPDPEDSDPLAQRIEMHADGCDIIWVGDARVRVTAGRRIRVDAREGVEIEALRAALLGPVWGILLAQRGILPLHASSVDIAGEGVAFAGASGQGKSTMAAALLERGHSLISDDISAIVWDDDGPSILPAFPQQKLEPESLAALGRSAEHLAPVHSRESKRLRPVGGRFTRERRPFRALIVLADADSESLQRLGPQAAFLELVRNTYRLEMVQDVLGRVAHMQAIARLVESVPVLRLERPRRLERLSELALRIEQVSHRAWRDPVA